MKRIFTFAGPHRTKAEHLLDVLSDHRWHDTHELCRRVGHTFAVAKFKLVGTGYTIEKRHHDTQRHQWQYRLRGTAAE